MTFQWCWILKTNRFRFHMQAKRSPQTEQQRQLARVTSNIGQAILAFFNRLRIGEEFHAADLHSAVGGAPASADRVMRELRLKKQINYEVVNRSQSLYRKTRIDKC